MIVVLDPAAESGITPAQAKQLRWKTVKNAAKLDPSLLKKVPALHIPYYDAQRKPTGFFRVRYLKTVKTGGGKVLRYQQPSGSPIRAYFPHVKGVSWAKLVKDPRKPILITEGEKKAAKATLEGFPCIGLGGVSMFSQKSLGQDLIPDLRDIDWKDRPTYLAYDSDVKSNANVRKELGRLAETLESHGAKVHIVDLPGSPGAKTGLDDYLIAHGAAGLIELINDADPFAPQSRLLDDFNRRFAVVAHPHIVVSLDDTSQRWKPADWADAFEHEGSIVSPRSFNGLMTPASRYWARSWPGTNRANRMRNAPGEPQFLEGGELNAWSGWGTTPKRGTVAPFLKMLDGLVGKGRTDEKRWLLQWLAYPIQHPGAKLYQAVVIWSPAQGVGKSALGKIMGRIHGSNYRLLTEPDLASNFNGWLEGLTFAMADDLPLEHAKALRAKLKTLITADDLQIAHKYQSPYQTKNTCNFLFTANGPSSVPLDPKSNRRFFVLRGPDKRPYPKPWYTGEFGKWVNGGGPAALHYYLLRYDLKGFEPHGDAPHTSDRDDAAGAAAADLDIWVENLMQDPSGFFVEHKLHKDSDLVTLDSLTNLYPGQTNRARMASALLAAGALRIGQVGSVPALGNRTPVIYAIRNKDFYRKSVNLRRAVLTKLDEQFRLA